MNRIKCLFGILLFTFFIPSVNALQYNIDVKTSNNKNLYDLKVSLTNISDTDYGVGSCSMNITLSGGVTFNGNVRTLGGWSMMSGNSYLFDTGNPALKDTEFMIIPLKVNNSGTVTLSNIYCSDGEDDVFIENKIINLKYDSSSNNNNGSNNNSNNNQNNELDDNKDNEVVLDSNCDLSNIILNKGTIEFDSSVTEYEIEIDDIDNLDVDVEVSSNKATYEIIRNEDNIVIEVTAEDGSKKTYTIYIKNNKEELDNKNNNQIYVPIFIGIICILVLINIIRIVKNMNRKG